MNEITERNDKEERSSSQRISWAKATIASAILTGIIVLVSYLFKNLLSSIEIMPALTSGSLEHFWETIWEIFLHVLFAILVLIFGHVGWGIVTVIFLFTLIVILLRYWHEIFDWYSQHPIIAILIAIGFIVLFFLIVIFAELAGAVVAGALATIIEIILFLLIILAIILLWIALRSLLCVWIIKWYKITIKILKWIEEKFRIAIEYYEKIIQKVQTWEQRKIKEYREERRKECSTWHWLLKWICVLWTYVKTIVVVIVTVLVKVVLTIVILVLVIVYIIVTIVWLLVILITCWLPMLILWCF